MTRERKNKLHTIIRGARIGLIACEIAKRLGISDMEALRRFYRSKTCQQFHDRSTGLYLYGDLYIVDDFLEETT